MNTKTQNLPFRENQKNHPVYISANVRKTLDTTLKPHILKDSDSSLFRGFSQSNRHVEYHCRTTL